MLPFFAGFDAAYFLKQYEPARVTCSGLRASGNPLMTNLAARYYFESDKTKIGIDFLEMMDKGAKDEQIRELYGYAGRR